MQTASFVISHRGANYIRHLWWRIERTSSTGQKIVRNSSTKIRFTRQPQIPGYWWQPTSALASFIGPRSWLVFTLLGLNGPKEWLQLPIYAVKCWSLFQDYWTARDYLVKLEVVNDSAECGIKLITDFKDMAIDEEQRQCVLQVVEFHSQNVKSLRKDDLAKLSSRTNWIAALYSLSESQILYSSCINVLLKYKLR